LEAKKTVLRGVGGPRKGVVTPATPFVNNLTRGE